jgi:DNA-binding NarL/FixJ family response regulator
MTFYQPIFATRQPLRISAVRQLLAGAGIDADPRVLYPEELERVLAGAGDCLVLLDGQCLPRQEVLLHLRRCSPGSRFVLWTDRLTTELLLATLECALHGLVSSRLPAEEASAALARICEGECLLRFDSAPCGMEPYLPKGQLAHNSGFDAQWMLDGAAPIRSET